MFLMLDVFTVSVLFYTFYHIMPGAKQGGDIQRVFEAKKVQIDGKFPVLLKGGRK